MILNSTSRFFIMAGAFSALLAVCLGAFGAHALKAHLSAYQVGIYKTAVEYQFYHALGLLLTGLIASNIQSRALSAAGTLMIIGSLLFSGSLYLLAISGMRWLGMITPLGGLGFIAAWCCLFYAAWQSRSTGTPRH